jgi:non-ribosomal peptide synthase protein (TIGR01720 family)
LHADLEKALSQIGAGEVVDLGPKTTSFKAWSNRLVHAGASHEGLDEDVAYWRHVDGRVGASLPRDFTSSAGEAAARDAVVVKLAPIWTEKLLRGVSASYRLNAGDALLAALARVLCRWSEQETVAIGLEGHGREDLFSDVDLSRTVGWFTSLYPVFLGSSGRLSTDLRNAKNSLRTVPNKGVGYGVLRYGSRNGELRKQLASVEPEIVWNYLGQLDGRVGSEHVLTPCDIESGQAANAETSSPGLFSIVSSIQEGQLQVVWDFSPSSHRRETVEELAKALVRRSNRLLNTAPIPAN